jgi:hypothetical protein
MAPQFGSDKVRNEAKQLKYSEKKVVFHTNLKHMFKHTVTDLDTQPTMMQQRLTCALKTPWLQLDGCCCLSDMGDKILFRINW